MVQMHAILFAGLFLAGNAASGLESASCALDGAEAVDEMLDSAIFIWASTERCKEKGEVVRCEVNVASAVESINGMLNVIVKALDNCGAIKAKHGACGMAAGVLTKSVAGLAAASGGIIAQCKNPLSPKDDNTVRATLADASHYGHSKFGACIVDVKDTMKSFFQAVKRMMTVKANCKGGSNSEACEHNDLKIVAAFASLGSFLAGSVDHCAAHGNENAECAGEVLALVQNLGDVGRAAVAMDKSCKLSAAQRLYLDNEDDEVAVAPATNNNSVTFLLATLLPITAVLSFVGGSRIAKARTTAPQEFEPLVAQELE